MDLSVLDDFARAVGPPDAGPVVCVGGRTQWTVGGDLAGPAREVSAPAGVVAHEPGEMIVRVRAGTTLSELDGVTATGGQFVALESAQSDRATVGGLLACGQSGLRRLGRGPIRDSLLEVTAVTAEGETIRAGAPLVKNVTGFDLCRLLVGSVGSLALLSEVVLRCQPRPAAETWWCSDSGAPVDPFTVFQRLYRPLAVLWDGAAVWVGLAGHPSDLRDQARAVLRPLGSWSEVAGPPEPPTAARRSLPPARLAVVLSELRETEPSSAWLAEIGVGMLHCDDRADRALEPAVPEAGVVELHRRLKSRFDPSGRLNPGRSPLGPVVAAT